ncbi:hypothetical protein Tco_1219795 [Tanacetum coccineum]
MEDDKETDKHEEVEVDDEAELKKHLVIVKDDDIAIDAMPLATKPPVIVEYKIIKEGIMAHYQLVRADGSSKRYSLMIRMLEGIDREDMQTLWKLVKTKYGDTRPEDEHERVFYFRLQPDFQSEEIMSPKRQFFPIIDVPALAPTRYDDEILPFNSWVPIGKSNFVLDLQKKQRNPIFQISVDILQNTNFFRAFTASASVPAIYVQQEALEITPIDQAHQFVSPPSGDAIIDFVNGLGYPGAVHFVSRMVVNHLYQPWRAILSMINQCLTGKTSGFAIQTFLGNKANLGSATKKDKKTKSHVIPYCWFTKLIIYYLGRNHNIHQMSGSPLNLAEDDHSLRNLKFVSKGETDEVFGMKIPKELIMDNIKNAPYYNAYLEMVAKHDQKIAAEEGGKKKSVSKAD